MHGIQSCPCVDGRAPSYGSQQRGPRGAAQPRLGQHTGNAVQMIHTWGALQAVGVRPEAQGAVAPREALMARIMAG